MEQKNIREKVINLTPIKEFTNVCPHCGGINTLYPKWKGKRVFHVCEKCGKATNGITASEWNRRHPDKKIDESVSKPKGGL